MQNSRSLKEAFDSGSSRAIVTQRSPRDSSLSGCEGDWRLVSFLVEYSKVHISYKTFCCVVSLRIFTLCLSFDESVICTLRVELDNKTSYYVTQVNDRKRS